MDRSAEERVVADLALLMANNDLVDGGEDRKKGADHNAEVVAAVHTRTVEDRSEPDVVAAVAVAAVVAVVAAVEMIVGAVVGVAKDYRVRVADILHQEVGCTGN